MADFYIEKLVVKVLRKKTLLRSLIGSLRLYQVLPTQVKPP